MGLSNISNQEVAQLSGNYKVMKEGFDLQEDAIILKLIKVMKKNRKYRLCAQLPTNIMKEKWNLEYPSWAKYIDPKLDIRRTVLSTVASYAEGPNGSSIMSVDLTNAYANIYLQQKNIYFKTKEGTLHRVQQPIQGLGIAGSLAPKVMHDYFKRIVRKLRRKIKKSTPDLYLQANSYSDNMIIVTNKPEIVKNQLKTELEHLFNDEQYQMINNTNNDRIRILGLYFQIKENQLKISRPRSITEQQRPYYNYLLGNQPFIKVNSGKELEIYCDGAAKIIVAHHEKHNYEIKEQENEDMSYVNSTTSAYKLGISGTGLYQAGKQLYAVTRKRRDIDQILSEAVSIKMANELREDIKRPNIPIKTDSQICYNIINNKRARQTLEQSVLNEVNNVQWIEGDDNLNDPVTKIPELTDKYERKRPRRKLYSLPTSPTRTEEGDPPTKITDEPESVNTTSDSISEDESKLVGA